MRNLYLILFAFVCFSVVGQVPKREMRGVWIASVANIDWPSQKNLTPSKQKDELVKMLDAFYKLHLNTIIIQIRPTADALYPSMIEPWSHWLTGKQGMRPANFYDPLQFIIEEAHKRFIDVHAWLNPYRVTNSEDVSVLSKDHLFFKRKQMFLKYGGKYYFNPGLDETRFFLNKVVEDIVSRYDVDAIHLDDYFYPYPVANEVFPDEATFKKYPRGYSPSQKNEWRRNNVNMVISELQKTIKTTKPWVEFGISPFGVWRNDNVDPKGSATRAGIQNYDDLNADILKWLREGTIDYVAPQLYWEIGKKVADYQILVKWWSENSYGKNLYIGHYASQLNNPQAAEAWKKGNELIRQMKMNRIFPQVDGSMFFSARPMLKNPQGLLDSLSLGFYKYPALCPVNRNIKGVPSLQPQNLRLVKEANQTLLVWDSSMEEGGCKPSYYVIYAFKEKKVGDLNLPSNIVARTVDSSVNITELCKKYREEYKCFAVTVINKYKHESLPSIVMEK